MQPQLLGQPVKHISFGKGIITNVSDQIVTVHFPEGEKRFLYPEAFSDFLTLKDEEKQKEINDKHNQNLQAEKAARKKECEALERRRQIRTMKITPKSQAAFHIDLNEADSMIEFGFVSAGQYLTGTSKGSPRIPKRLKPNSACLLTGIPQGGAEKDRKILGVFMVKENFWGEHCLDGMVEAHVKYKICLPSDMTLFYWAYFEHNDTFPRWGNVPLKYFSNHIMQKILLDLVSLFTDTEKKPLIDEFYQYFCEINRLSVKQTESEKVL